MARSAKTKHVLDLVGTEPIRKISPSLQELQRKSSPLLNPPNPIVEEESAEPTEPNVEEPTAEADVQEQEKLPAARQGMTFIVGELINQELERVVARFNLTATDSNLWELTRSAIETIRPEFSRNGEEYFEKCDKLRPRVIKEMTKAAVRIVAKDKRKRE